MSASNTFETALLELIFNNEALAGVADALSIAGSLYVSLHTSDPGEAGDQETNETDYTSYARVAVSRDSAGWTVVNNAVTNTAIVSFPMATGGTSTVTHFGIGTNSTGAGLLLFKGALTAPLDVSNGIRPIFDVGDLQITVD